MNKFEECSVLRDIPTVTTDNTHNLTTIKNNLYIEKLNKHMLGDMNSCYGFDYPTKEKIFNKMNEIIRVLNKITNPEV